MVTVSGVRLLPIAGCAPESETMRENLSRRSVTAHPPLVVGVVASPAALDRASRLRRPPDLFEMRLDALRDSLGGVTRALPDLRAPLLLTARHRAEGGQGALSAGTRRAMLARFLDRAAAVDLELRSLPPMQPLLEELRRRRIDLFISSHHLHDTPPVEELLRLTKAAAAFRPALIKIATRTDTPAQLERLLAFFRAASRQKIPIAAMGLGDLGIASRRQLSRLGSALLYVSLGHRTIEGQPTLDQLRRARGAYNR